MFLLFTIGPGGVKIEHPIFRVKIRHDCNSIKKDQKKLKYNQKIIL